MIGDPLAVWLVLSDPQAPAEPQVGLLQSTPAFWASNATVATRLSVVPIGTPADMGDTTIDIGSTVTVTDLDTDESATDVAVMVTVPFGGITVGAV